MNYIKNLPKIKKLSRKVGTPLKSISFDEGGVKFTFVVENEVSISFADRDAGVQQVLDWLVGMLSDELKPAVPIVADEIDASEEVVEIAKS